MLAPMWQGVAALALLVSLILSGCAGAHRNPGDPVHLDFEFEPYVVGEPLFFRLLVSNPGNETASYWWPDSCVLAGIIYSEQRTLWSGPSMMCLTVVVSLDVPPDSSVTFVWGSARLDTTPDDGCIRFELAFNGYPVTGSATTCPLPAVAPPERLILTESVPRAAISGDVLPVGVAIRTSGGIAVEGVRVDLALDGEEVGSATTDASGKAFMRVEMPRVDETTLALLSIRASGEGWRNASVTLTLSIFPPDRRYLVVENRFSAGDILHAGEPALLEVTVRGNDGHRVAEASLAVELTGPLALEENVAVGDGRHRLTFRAGEVPEGRVASVRIVANAPGWEGGETIADYAVLPPTPSTGRDIPESIDIPPWEILGALGTLAAIALVSLALLRRHRRLSSR